MLNGSFRTEITQPYIQKIKTTQNEKFDKAEKSVKNLILTILKAASELRDWTSRLILRPSYYIPPHFGRKLIHSLTKKAVKKLGSFNVQFFCQIKKCYRYIINNHVRFYYHSGRWRSNFQDPCFNFDQISRFNARGHVQPHRSRFEFKLKVNFWPQGISLMPQLFTKMHKLLWYLNFSLNKVWIGSKLLNLFLFAFFSNVQSFFETQAI